MNELIVRVEQQPAEITCNFDELEAHIKTIVAEYNGAQFTEESIPIAKSTVADLRKQKKELDDKRKSIKKIYMKPYERFEAGVNTLTKLYDEPINMISGQIKEFEEAKKAAKRKLIAEIYDEIALPYVQYIPLDKIYDPKWENATMSLKRVKEDIQKYVADCEHAISSIKATNSDAVEEALNIYRNTLDVMAAMAHINQYEKQKAEILLHQKELEMQKQQEKQEVETQKTASVVSTEESAFEQNVSENKTFEQMEMPWIIPDDEQQNVLPFEQPNTYKVLYKVIVTKEEQEAVEMAFNSIGIYFERRVEN